MVLLNTFNTVIFTESLKNTKISKDYIKSKFQKRNIRRQKWNTFKFNCIGSHWYIYFTLPYQPFHSTWGEHRPLTIFLHFLLSWAWVSASFSPWSLRANLFCICSCLAFKISCSSGSFCCQCFCNKCSFSEIGLSALSLSPIGISASYWFWCVLVRLRFKFF